MAIDHTPTFHKSPAIRGGRVEVHALANSARLDVIGQDQKGRPVRLETRHYKDIGEARITGAWCAVALCIPYHDCSAEVQP